MTTELIGTYDTTLIAVSVAVAVYSSFVALATVPRIHCAMNTRWDVVWSFVFGLSMGTGIWSMHFIGMLGFDLPVPIHYDTTLTALSLLLAINVAHVGTAPTAPRVAHLVQQYQLRHLPLRQGCADKTDLPQKLRRCGSRHPAVRHGSTRALLRSHPR
ncbi:MAG: hypothetical protein COV97_06200 [Zetaproteobacteria bacterium CG11_big_fil_rev_8_21_14_0_20_59_439]|nr:MAG: hypothetical protein COV97_06200 [Zetaproteobacteria bacterium CG11_big_fil_rev_8_21_14_0_20_59_439]PIU96800.1 MAG: hypothetical protein COS62_07325 [Zetaproteobacteria bacterium CG03_land_8_20_14_0_80_59_51]HCS13988.1 hypothetical protein [Zetaproteobacteria bacterium]